MQQDSPLHKVNRSDWHVFVKHICGEIPAKEQVFVIQIAGGEEQKPENIE